MENEDSIVVSKAKIDKLMNGAQLDLADLLDGELYEPVKQELKQYHITHSLGIKKELFKHKMELVFEYLKKVLQKGSE